MAPKSAHTHSTKTEMMTVDMSYHLIGDKGSTGCLSAQQVSVSTCGVAEVVDGERLVFLIDEFYDLTDVLEGEHWHDWAKDLFSHQLRVKVRL